MSPRPGDVTPAPWRIRALLLALMVPNLAAWVLAVWVLVDVATYESVDLQPLWAGAPLLVALLAVSAAILWLALMVWRAPHLHRSQAAVVYALACLTLWSAVACLIAFASPGSEILPGHL